MDRRQGAAAVRMRIVPLALFAILLTACAAPQGAGSSAAASPGETPLTATFPSGEFGDPTTIDNPWLPMTPGTTWVWEGETLVDGEAVDHRIVSIVTDLTKVIDGVQTRAVYDRDYSGGELIEAELLFLAQDNAGTIWHLGQYPEEYENGEFIDSPGWIAGVAGALAGIWMPADPQVGQPDYSQGWGPAVGWTDRGRVVEAGVEDCVPVDCYSDVLVIEEWALDHPEAKQLKYYARDVGNTRVGWSGSEEQEQETLELVEFRQLTDAELQEARAEALALDERSYENLPHVFGETEPAQAGS
jgi:hypothetical protein